jgi:hypothetical protein
MKLKLATAVASQRRWSFCSSCLRVLRRPWRLSLSQQLWNVSLDILHCRLCQDSPEPPQSVGSGPWACHLGLSWE